MKFDTEDQILPWFDIIIATNQAFLPTIEHTDPDCLAYSSSTAFLMKKTKKRRENQKWGQPQKENHPKNEDYPNNEDHPKN